ncbi:Golgi membrane exchange factor (Ric1p-Rgp1p) subunit [Elasticomyces elasticus]|nr:Golgi membrane exchange factor (Ric1p-Rgp1p) subunit [Elasticomyces elasticus]
MGYAQTMGHFTLDGSLVNQAPFEEVKRRGVVGGKGGGGVVGVDHSRRESGLFGAFGWSNIGNSLGGLLGGNEMSSIKEMRGIATSKLIPLLSTPQRLQRSGKVGSQQVVKHVEVPFRVLGSVNGRGEILGHDLMSPYILLNDNVRTSSITPSSPLPTNIGAASKPHDLKSDAASLADFLSYTDALLAHPHVDPNAPLASPTATRLPPLPRQSSTYEEPQLKSMREAIDYAIMRANVRTPPAGPESTLAEHQNQAANRFNIARSGMPIAVLTLLRPAFRLGESMIGTLDFSTAAVPIYAIKVELESAEHIDPALALRSAGSMQRVTRTVHAEMRESALFAQRLSFNLTIPTTATPTFETTGVSLQWMVRVEFTTARTLPGGVREDREGELLEELGRDERALTMIAKERLLAEAFEVGIPIKVDGVVTGEMDGKESEGLVV